MWSETPSNRTFSPSVASRLPDSQKNDAGGRALSDTRSEPTRTSGGLSHNPALGSAPPRFQGAPFGRCNKVLKLHFSRRKPFLEGQPRRFVRPGPNKPSGQVFPAVTPRNPPETPQKPPGARPPEATNHGFGTQCQTPGRSDRPGRMDGWMDGWSDRPTDRTDGWSGDNLFAFLFLWVGSSQGNAGPKQREKRSQKKSRQHHKVFPGSPPP